MPAKSLFDQLLAIGGAPQAAAEALEAQEASLFDDLMVAAAQPQPARQQRRPRSKRQGAVPIQTSSAVARQLLRRHDPRRPPGKMVGLDVFSGAGGFLLGAQEQGVATVGVERNPLAVQTGRRAGHAVAQMDVAEVADARVPVDILIGGPPCQPFSSAGARRGQYDPREGFQLLMPVLDAVKPRRMVVENVSAFLAPRHKGYRDQIFSQLRKRFRHVGAWVLNAKHFGVPQDRERVFIWGAERKLEPPRSTHGPGTGRRQVSVRQRLPHLAAEGYDAIMPFQTTARARSTGRPGFTVTTRRNAYAVIGIHWRYDGSGSVPKDKRRILRPDETLIIQAFPEGFSFAGTLGDQQCQIGNAVPPPLASAVVGAIKAGLQPRKLLPEELMDAFSVIDESIFVLEPRPWVDRALVGVLVDPPYLGRPGIIPVYAGAAVRDCVWEWCESNVEQQLAEQGGCRRYGHPAGGYDEDTLQQQISNRALDWLYTDKASHYEPSAPRVLPLQLFSELGVPRRRVFEVFAQGPDPFQALLISSIMKEAWPVAWDSYRGNVTDLAALRAHLERHGLDEWDIINEGIADAATLYN
jgi:DNA (cytosine-5)-methyltransferase 1